MELNKIDSLQLELVEKWHSISPQPEFRGFLGLVEKQHLQNFLLWHEEDIARAPDVDDAEIARVKRSIDRLNQTRNDLIEQLDEAILQELTSSGIKINQASPINSETPGSIIDRCSIMALKIFHMNEQAARNDVDQTHLEEARRKVKILVMQRSDLVKCLFELIADIESGRRQFKLYRQFKMYNDPSLNPRIYSAQQSQR